MHFKSLNLFSFVFAAAFLLIAYTNSAHAQLEAGCHINTAGDYICPLGADPGSGENATLGYTPPSGSSVFSPGSPIFNSINNVGGIDPSILAQLMSLFDDLPASLRDLLMDELISLLSGDPNVAQILDLINTVTNLDSDLSSLDGLLCPGGGTVARDLTSYAENTIALNFDSSGPSFDINNLGDSLCSEASDPPSSMGTVAGTGGERIAQAAEAMINETTADHPDTQGGAVGCAVAVSRILERAGYGLGGIYPGTATLYDKLRDDPCYTQVDTGDLSSDDKLNLQRGDVLVTARNASTGRAGHTGIYVGNGEIISNSSSGFAGSAPGTIQKNYNVDRWNSGVISRNPSVSAVYRYTC
ncbi:MAG: peptidoglycan amidohydrolase family protein [Bdellovibrionales bacterium]